MLTQEQYEKRKRKYLESRMKSFKKHLAKKSNYRDENDYLQQVRFSNRSGSHINCFRYFPNNTDEHEIEKFLKFVELRKRGHRVLVEPIFKDGRRADILNLTDGVIIEIGVSEDEEKFKEKVKKYPDVFEYEFIKVKQCS